MAPVPVLGLRTDDRLEPSANLQDVYALADAVAPIDVVFWRMSSDTLSRHRNPLFCPELGLSPKRNLTVDELHANHLGPMKIWCKVVVWFVLLSGVYGQLGTREENVAAAVLALRHDLMAWYKTADVRLTRVTDLKPKMVGTPSDQKMKTKAAETWGLMLFLAALLTRHANTLGSRGQRYLAAGLALKHVVDVTRACAMRVPADKQQEPWGEQIGTTPNKKQILRITESIRNISKRLIPKGLCGFP
jgi:hypothetical protein